MPKANENPFMSFVIPCYNEGKNIAATINELTTAVCEANIPSYEIVIVNDCSTDDTLEVANHLAHDNSNIAVITNPMNLGFGGAYKAGVKGTRGKYVIMIPGDNAFPASSIAAILHKAGTADLVIPYVINSQIRPRRRQRISNMFTAIFNLLFWLRVPYYNGIVLHTTSLLRSIEIKTDGFAFQAESIVRLLTAGATYTTVGIAITERKHGGSSAFNPRNIFRVIRSTVSLFFELRVARWLGLRRSTVRISHRP
jgi:glycosyltransferase involved in cell wall biosynthesis